MSVKESFNDSTPLYSSRIILNYTRFLKKFYPGANIERILEKMGISWPDINDPGFWFSQKQGDAFQVAVNEETGNIGEIPREAGRYTTSSDSLGPLKSFAIGFMSISRAYYMLGKLYPHMSRGARVKVVAHRARSVEIVSVPAPGVNEKLYQCENRIGTFEALARLFSGKLAEIRHPECFHRGDPCCRYLIKWDLPVAYYSKRFRSYGIALIVLGALAISPFLPVFFLPGAFMISALLILLICALTISYEERSFKSVAESQGDVSADHMRDINVRYSNAMLVQEICRVTAELMDTRRLVEIIFQTMKKRLDFSCGLVLLREEGEAIPALADMYGRTEREYEGLKEIVGASGQENGMMQFLLQVFHERKSSVVDDEKELERWYDLNGKEFERDFILRGIIAVPVSYREKCFGVLAVINTGSNRLLVRSEVSLLTGIASQMAVGIVRARESEKKYRELVENANNVIMRVDTEGGITLSNSYARSFFGLPVDEVNGKNILEVINDLLPDGRSEFETLKRSLEKEPQKSRVLERNQVRGGGERVWVAWTMRPVFDRKGTFKEILCVGTDITELKKSEIEREELENRLQQAKKMEAIGLLAGGVAHDLNNILCGIVGYPDLLLMDLAAGSPFRKPIETIQKSGERAATIVQDLLAMARKSLPRMEALNINGVVSEVLKSPEFEKLIKYHGEVKVKLNLDENLPGIKGSGVHLAKTILNLLSNAAEAMPDGGDIKITTEVRRYERSVEGDNDTFRGNYVALLISDEGVGISPEDQERIFEPFYTKKVMGRSGTGLGMAVVRSTVNDHKGYIETMSSRGRGTTFTLYFPSDGEKVAEKSPSSSRSAYIGSGEYILVVDDVSEQRELASEILTRLGYRVVAVKSGEEAISYIKENKVDIVVIDMIMEPGMDGLDTYRGILKVRPGQRAVIASGFAETERIKETLRLGAGTLVKKPYHINDIGKAISEELTKQ